MYCEKCGNSIPDGAKFCSGCGNDITTDNLTTINPEKKTPNTKSINKLLVSPDEQIIASLGDSYLNSYLSSRKLERCIAILTNLRIYLYGTMFDNNNGIFSRYRTETIINVEDITGSGFVYCEPKLWKLIIGILLTIISAIGAYFIFPLILLIPGIFLIVSYFTSRGSMFFIEYAGGCINFDASIYGINESREFHKQIRRVQDNLKGIGK